MNPILAVAVLLASASTHAAARDFDVEYCDITGQDIQQLREELDAKGPRNLVGRRFHGLTEWTVGWSYNFASTGKDHCALTGLEANLELKVVLPRWQSPQRASPRLLQEWERYSAALLAHEEGHVSIAREAREEIQRSSERPWTATSCGATEDGERCSRRNIGATRSAEQGV